MKKPKPPIDHETRDRIANQVMLICMTDLSHQMSSGSVQPQHFGHAIEVVARVSYSMADAMLIARTAK